MACLRLEIDGKPVNISVFMANSWFKRLVGLLNRSHLSDSEALVLIPCSSIHTVGMRFSIDAVFLDKAGKVVGIKENLKPFRFCIAPKSTKAVLELAAGNVKRTGISLEQVHKFV